MTGREGPDDVAMQDGACEHDDGDPDAEMVDSVQDEDGAGEVFVMAVRDALDTR